MQVQGNHNNLDEYHCTVTIFKCRGSMADDLDRRLDDDRLRSNKNIIINSSRAKYLPFYGELLDIINVRADKFVGFSYFILFGFDVTPSRTLKCSVFCVYCHIIS